VCLSEAPCHSWRSASTPPKALKGSRENTDRKTAFFPEMHFPSLFLSVLEESRIFSLCSSLISSSCFHLLNPVARLCSEVKALRTWGLGHLAPGFPQRNQSWAWRHTCGFRSQKCTDDLSQGHSQDELQPVLFDIDEVTAMAQWEKSRSLGYCSGFCVGFI